MVEFERLKREELTRPAERSLRADEDTEGLREVTLEPDGLDGETPFLAESERIVLCEELLILEEPKRELDPRVPSEA